MREIRQSGSEGGGAGVTTGPPYPYAGWPAVALSFDLLGWPIEVVPSWSLSTSSSRRRPGSSLPPLPSGAGFRSINFRDRQHRHPGEGRGPVFRRCPNGAGRRSINFKDRQHRHPGEGRGPVFRRCPRRRQVKLLANHPKSRRDGKIEAQGGGKRRSRAPQPWVSPHPSPGLKGPHPRHDLGSCQSMHQAPHELERELPLAAAIHWYQQGRVSMEKAAELATLSRPESWPNWLAEKSMSS